MTRPLAFLARSSLVLSLAACGGGSSTSPGVAGTQSAASAPEAVAAVAATSSVAAPAATPSSPAAEAPVSTAPATTVADVTTAITATTTPTAPTAPTSAASATGTSATSATPAPAIEPAPAVVVATAPSAPSTPAPASTPATSDTTSTLPSTAPAPAAAALAPAGQDASQYTLTFNDEFNAGSTIDAGKWTSDIYYKANNATKNFNVEGGALNIWPALDASGRFFDRTVVTENRFAQQYGFFEVEAKLPVGAGLHPVISLTANNGPEIAMMHAYSGAPNGAWSSSNLAPVDYVVTAMRSPDSYIDEFRARSAIGSVDLSAAFHKYGVRWDANSVKYYFDGVQIGHTVNQGEIRTPMYFYVGLWMVNEETSPAVGAGTLGASNAYTPQGKGNAMKINYVRAWQFTGQ
ncbi:glycoside hydrolase family 16 protein [Noviherbaspirillum galbum]|uniref:Glycoside hydrolase family 16 protein n=1 Tax=Noviherbaspirillum galbum TaxID=2709383 RepID=A0A6B3ST86_9BURK|nr:glycoside hydrolase family 16 protein [Noviherbaspirillum galbum]NEX62545.1 glycoside hydrolase family 16 protein [Noviherbaspirillum galbum]